MPQFLFGGSPVFLVLFVIFPKKVIVSSKFLSETFFFCFVELFPAERQVMVYLYDFSI